MRSSRITLTMFLSPLECCSDKPMELLTVCPQYIRSTYLC